MKTILLTVLSLLLIVGCSDKEKEKVYDPPQLALSPDYEIVIPTAEALREMEDLIKEEIDFRGEIVTGYPLNQFVDVDYPQLYVYEIMSDDEDGNWSPRLRGMEELRWQDILSGYLVPEKDQRTHFTDPQIVGTYNVKSAGYLRLYRSVEVIIEGKTVAFQLGALETKNISFRQENEQFDGIVAIPLNSFISDYVTIKKSDYSYLLNSVEAEDVLYDWQQINNAYLVGEEVLFMESDNGSKTVTGKEENLLSITLIEDSRF